MMIQTNSEPRKRQSSDENVSRQPSQDWITFRNITALILREMSTRYGKNPGGYLWAFLEPLGAILVLSIAFSVLFRNPGLGSSFILFYATGFVPFWVYQQVSSTVSRAIVFSRPLLMYPIVRWTDAIFARAILNSLTAIFAGYIIIGVFVILEDVHVVVRVIPALSAVLLALYLGFGIGVLNCALMGLWPTWGIVWSIITRPLFIVSGVLFLFDHLPLFAREILVWNPLVHVIGLSRVGFYPTYNPNYISVLYVLTWATVTTLVGMILMARYHRYILNRR